MDAENTPLAAGHFCWVDVAVTDPAVTHKFFTELFGWSRRVRPTEEAQAYSIMTAHGEHVAGVCNLVQGEAKVIDLGGKVLRSAIEIKTFGTMSVVEDPGGAIFALWQSARGEHRKPRHHGMVSWYELVSTDIDAASQFYTKLAGWTGDETTYDDAPFIVLKKEGREHAGLRPAKGAEPSQWLIYFAVDACDQTAARCTEIGGTVEVPPFEVDGLGRCAMLCDPSGGYFGVFEYH